MVLVEGLPKGSCRAGTPAAARTAESDGKSPVVVQVKMAGAPTELFAIELLTNNKLGVLPFMPQ